MSSYLAYQPTSLDEVVLPPSIFQSLTQMVKHNAVENMIFYGQPGTGKSLTARLLATNHVFLRCDGGESPSEMLATARGAGRSLSVFDDERKVIILDELDTLNVTAQAKFRAIIDECGHNATFIATTNYIDSIIPALKSRLRPVCFDHDRGSITLKSAWRQRLQAIHRAHFKCEIDESLLTQAIMGYPDARQMISAVTTRSIS